MLLNGPQLPLTAKVAILQLRSVLSVPATVDDDDGCWDCPTRSRVIADVFDAGIARYLAERGAPASVIGHLMMTPPSQIYWLTPQELADWGVQITR